MAKSCKTMAYRRCKCLLEQLQKLTKLNIFRNKEKENDHLADSIVEE